MIVKPVSLLRLTGSEEAPSRVRSLRILAALKLSDLYFLSGLDRTLCSVVRAQLDEYFSALPQAAKLTVFEEIQREGNSRLEQSFSSSLRPNQGTDVGFLAWAIFGLTGSSLELSEFLSGGGKQIFQHLIRPDANPQEFSHITSLQLGSSEISGERLSFVYEVTESVWKPELRRLFATSLTALAQLTLTQFCDDDTLCLVGQCCPRLQLLRIKLSPESFNEQQLSDDGFEELAKYQEHWPSLRELDIQECFSSSITSRTILSLARIETLTSLHTRSFHFSWLDLTRKMNIDRVKPNRWLKFLSINFYPDDAESFDAEGLISGHSEAVFARILLSAIGDLFPSITELAVAGIHSDLLHSAVDFDQPPAFLTESLAPRLVHLRIKKCSTLLSSVARHLPQLRSLELSYCPLEGTPSGCLDQLTVLKVSPDEYRDVVDYADLRALLIAAPRLKEFYLVNAIVYVNSWAGNERRLMSEAEFLDLFTAAPHLQQNLEVLSLAFSQESLLTASTVLALLARCPRLRRLENLLSWRLRGPEELGPPELLLENFKMGMVCATRSHWSLHWRGEDGRYHEPSLPVDRF